MGTLANTSYAQSSAYNAATNSPIDVVVEVAATGTGTTSGFVAVFVQVSLDGGTTYQSPATPNATDETNMTFVGTVPVTTTSQVSRKAFSLFSALGFIPQRFKIVAKNATGAALASGEVYVSEVTTA